MFRVEHNVPEYYIKESRDFQLISRLYDLPFQSVRQSSLTLQNATNTKFCNSSLLPLLSTKLGFFQDLDLPDKTYREVLSAFPYIIRHKGTPYAIQLIANVFEKLVNTEVECEIETDHATIKFYKYSPSSELLFKLINYVRPTGYVINWLSYLTIDVKDTNFISTNTYSVSATKDVKEANVIVNDLNNYDDTSSIGFVVIPQTPTPTQHIEEE